MILLHGKLQLQTGANRSVLILKIPVSDNQSRAITNQDELKESIQAMLHTGERLRRFNLESSSKGEYFGSIIIELEVFSLVQIATGLTRLKNLNRKVNAQVRISSGASFSRRHFTFWRNR
jgi:hypothetical protein